MNEVWSVFLSTFLQSFFSVALPALATIAASWLVAKAKKAWQDFKTAHYDEALLIQEVAEMAVKAAEQAKLGELIDDKKSYAMDIMEKVLAGYGIKLDLEVIDAAIEAAVMSEFNKNKVAQG